MRASGVSVRLAQTKIGTGELMSLRVGDVITTQKDVKQPVIVSVEGVPKFRAKIGAFKGQKAIMIDGTIGWLVAMQSATLHEQSDDHGEARLFHRFTSSCSPAVPKNTRKFRRRSPAFREPDGTAG